MTESEIQKDILTYLKTVSHVHVWRQNSGRVQKNVILAPNGCPDIIGYVKAGPRRGLFLGFEVKQPGKKLRPSQKTWKRNMDQAGALFFVVHSVAETREIVEAYFNDGQTEV